MIDIYIKTIMFTFQLAMQRQIGFFFHSRRLSNELDVQTSIHSNVFLINTQPVSSRSSDKNPIIKSSNKYDQRIQKFQAINRILWYLVLCRSRRHLKHSHGTRKHELREYGIVRGRVTAINIIIHHFARYGHQRSTSEQNPVYVKVLSLAIPTKAKGS